MVDIVAKGVVMQTAALNTYRSHELAIMMRTSSGDVIEMNFKNEKELLATMQKEGGRKQSAIKLSSLQEFNFSLQTKNGIDEQDKKEIAAFMELAKPYIDKFLKELKEDAPRSSVTKIAQDISKAFYEIGQKEVEYKNYAKKSMVAMFDKALEDQKATKELFDKMFEASKRLLEQTFKLFDEPKKALYA